MQLQALIASLWTLAQAGVFVAIGCLVVAVLVVWLLAELFKPRV